LSVPAVVILYFLRTRWKSLPVGSTFIWRLLVDKNDGGRRLRRRSLLLLALQLGAAIAGTLAAAGPRWKAERLLEPGLAFLVDASASMSVPDGPDGGARIGLAARIIAERLTATAPGTPLALLAGSSRLDPVFGPSKDKEGLLRAVREISASGRGLAEDTVAAGLKAWLAAREESWTVLFVTDGCLEQGGKPLADAAGNTLSTEIVGSRPPPPSVSGLRLRDEGGHVFASFLAFNGSVEIADAMATMMKDDEPLAEERIALEPGWSRHDLDWAGTAGTGAYELAVRATTSGDEPADSQWPGGRYRVAVNRILPARVLVIGPPDPYLRILLSSSGVEALGSTALPTNAAPGEWDLAVSCGPPIPEEFPADVLLLGPEATSAAALPDTQTAGAIPEARSPFHPVNRYVDWSEFGSSAGFSLKAPPEASVLASVSDSPVAAAWTTRAGYRRVALAVSPSGSRFALSPSWPVFLRNVLSWCRPPVDRQSAWTLAAGQPVERAAGPEFSAKGVSFRRTGSRIILQADVPGWFSWSDRTVSGPVSGTIAVNIPASELDAMPRTGTPRPGSDVPAARLVLVETDLSPIAIAAMLAFLVAEWLLWRGKSKRRSAHG
ncbi:MAG: VWA domain-containing protein, partial [Spirochaetales bacterium]